MSNRAIFGPFELDVDHRELRKHGIRLRLPEQSFEILSLLAGHPGQVVTREEIRDRLWPGGTVVEFEHSINAALKRLRDTLGESATQPRFIETVSRRGYVFIAPVQHAAANGPTTKFRLLDEAGRGAMGIVYRAEDLSLGRTVALKFLPEQMVGGPAALEQLRREARAAAALNHPNICTLHGIEEHNGRPCLVMEFLEGQPLSRVIESGPLPPAQAIDIATQACDALEAAHARGIVHRDLKPANLFITGSGRVKLTDFGIAVRTGDTRAAQAGTPSYMSPEQVHGEALDGRSDIFSLGMVLFEMMTGRRVAGRAGAEQSSARLPKPVQGVVLRCLAENPTDRFQSAAELRTALAAAKREAEPEASRVPKRWRWRAAATAIVLAMGAFGILWKLGMLASPKRSAVRSIAVLPLENLSRDPEQEYFADGMTDQLIAELAQIGAWNVIARTSVMRYKRTRESVRKIGRDLGVDGVIEGTVLRSGERVRITVQLIDAGTEQHLWARSFERAPRDVIALQADIARTIAGELNLTLSPQQEARLGRQRTVPPDAYDDYLRGWYFFNRAQYQTAASYFERATRADPGFALAYALLGEADSMASFSQDLPPSDRALAAAAKARELDDSLAEVHALTGDALSMGWEWESGLVEYRRAAELDPASVDAARHYAIGLHAQRRWEASERELSRALHMDPASPLLNYQMLLLLVDMHRYEAALEQFQRLVELDPSSANAYSEASRIYGALGRDRDAVSAFLKSQSLSGASPESVNDLAVAAVHGGLQSCLRVQLQQLQQQSKHRHVSPVLLASVHARLGDEDTAFALLETAYREHNPRLMWIKARSIWDPLRADPRFQDLLRRLRFPP